MVGNEKRYLMLADQSLFVPVKKISLSPNKDRLHVHPPLAGATQEFS